MTPRLRPASWRAGLLVIAGVMCLGACGRKGPVRPPELAVPAPISGLGATNDVEAIVLAWPRPTAYADGRRMTDLGSFVVQRASGPARTFATVATLEVGDRDRFRQVKRFRYADRGVVEGERYTYRVMSVTIDGYESEPSNAVEIVREAAAPRTAAETKGGAQ